MKPLLKGLLVGAATAVAGFVFYLTPAGRFVEQNIGLDWLFTLRGVLPPPAEVVVVAMDKASSRQLGLPEAPLKWPRDYHARVIDILKHQGARGIVFDVLFRDSGDAVATEALRRAIDGAGNVLLFQYLDLQRIPGGTSEIALQSLESPLPALQQAAVAVAPFPLPKVPAKVSQFWTFRENLGEVPTLPAVAAQIYWLNYYPQWRALLQTAAPELAAQLPAEAGQLLATRRLVALMSAQRRALSGDAAAAGRLAASIAQIVDDPSRRALVALLALYRGDDSRYLNFVGPARSVHTIPFYKILDRDAEALAAVKERLVFVGLSEPMQLERVDTFYTPFSQDDGVELSGVEIMATATTNLLTDHTLRTPPVMVSGLLFFLWAWLLAQLPRWFGSPVHALSLAAAAIALYFTTDWLLFSRLALWLPLTLPLLLIAPLALFASFLWRYREARQDRQKIRRALGYYVPEPVIDDIARSFSQPHTQKQLVLGTCMATDAEQYTRLAENLPPPELGRLLDQYYGNLFQPVTRHQGFVSDVVGDAMMAIWTSAGSGTQHRQQACDAALAILQLQQHYQAAGRDLVLRTRIGIHSGEILLGNVGAMNHYEYRAVGDITNTAARIESLGKQLNRYALASAATLEGLEGVRSQSLGRFILAGKSTPLEIHALLTEQQYTVLKREALPQFAHALQDFQQGRWPRAQSLFADLARRYDDDLSRFYGQLCDRYLQQAPPPNWHGEVIQQNK